MPVIFHSIIIYFSLFPLAISNSNSFITAYNAIRFETVNSDNLLNYQFPSDTTSLKKLTYVVAGSFLIPRNADLHINKLKKLGFHKCFKHIFPDSEYYSVIIDTFVSGDELTILTNKLKINKIDYFIKTEESID